MNSSKIGVATYHYSFNEGAILQAFATTQLIKQHIGVAGEIIDQRYPGKLSVYGPANDLRKKALLTAIDNWLPTSQKKFRSQKVSSDLYQYINKSYSKLIIGSDVVWNLRYQRRLRSLLGKGIFPRQPYDFFTPFPNLYWPNKQIDIPIYSYAAAIGTLEYDDIPFSHRIRMREHLKRFRLISVRDERTRRFIEFIDPMIAKNVEIVPDPTLGYNFENLSIDKVKIKKKLEKNGFDFNKPSCCVISKDDPELDKFCNQLRSRGYQIISLTTKNKMADINLYDKGFHPLEWSAIFSFFDFCITERMHGAIFCLKNLTPFIVIDINETRLDNDSKTQNLMRRFDLLNYRLPKSKINHEVILELFNNLMATSESWKKHVSDKLISCQIEAKLFYDKINLD